MPTKKTRITYTHIGGPLEAGVSRGGLAAAVGFSLYPLLYVLDHSSLDLSTPFFEIFIYFFVIFYRILFLCDSLPREHNIIITLNCQLFFFVKKNSYFFTRTHVRMRSILKLFLLPKNFTKKTKRP